MQCRYYVFKRLYKIKFVGINIGKTLLQYCLWIHIPGKDKHHIQGSGYLWGGKKEKGIRKEAYRASLGICDVLLLKLVVGGTWVFGLSFRMPEMFR